VKAALLWLAAVAFVATIALIPPGWWL